MSTAQQTPHALERRERRLQPVVHDLAVCVAAPTTETATPGW